MIDWMAALNLYRYAELFRDKGITGRDLMLIDEAALLVSGASWGYHLVGAVVATSFSGGSGVDII